MSDLYAKARKMNDQFLSSKWLSWYFGPVFLCLLLGTLFFGLKVAVYGAGASVALVLFIVGSLQLLIGFGAFLKRELFTGVCLVAFGFLLLGAAVSFIAGFVAGAYA